MIREASKGAMVIAPNEYLAQCATLIGILHH
jgi:hypothetical protein